MTGFIILTCFFGVLLGVVVVASGYADDKWSDILLGAIIIAISIVSLIYMVVKDDYILDTYYLPAEPLAYNTTQTVFITDQGTYTVDGIYSNNKYLLALDTNNTKNTSDDIVLVVWEIATD